MKPVKMMRAPNRLAQIMAMPGGFSAREAVRRSEAAVETMRAPCLETIDAVLAEIEARYGPSAPDRDGADFEDLYVLCTRIIDASIAVRGTGLDDAARAFCDLVDLSSVIGRWDWPAVEVHIEALRLLRRSGEGMEKAQRQAVIGGLIKVTRKRVGDPAALAAAAEGEA
ncbi:MAG TPA: chemotaxis protein CheE [Caulobacteraceae bacterium]|nr:chemotaxis protein CheE [Caulobacteraceae bacterium]